MIYYALKCAEGHTFESWFQSADAFDKLQRSGLVECSVCGCTSVERAVMSPRVNGAAKKKEDRPPMIRSKAEQAVRALQQKMEKEADYVGSAFADEARAIHDGTAPERPIYGEARLAEARSLLQDGIPVAPLPFIPSRKTN